YFNLDCKKAPFKVLYCAATGTPDSLVLEAPEGFKYRWYSNDYPNFSSDSRRITVPADSATYFCEITFLNTNRCGKTVTMVASPSHNGGSYTHADFAFIKEIANCTYNLRLINNSYTSDARQTYRDYNCDYFFWDFGDSTTSDQESPGVHTYAEHGTYTIMLVAGNTELQCYDTIYKTVSFDPPEVPLLASDTIVCVGDSFALIVQGSTLDSFLWSSGDSTRVFSRTMGHIPFILSVRVVDTLGCVTLLNTRVIPDSVPVPMFDSLYFASCNPLKVHFTDRNPRSSENIMYKWYWGTGDSIETSDSVEYLYSEPGMYDIRCVVNSVNGCADTVRARAFSYNYTKAEFHWETFFGRITAPDMHFLNRSAPHEPEQNYYRWVFFADSAGTDSLFTSYDFEPSYRWPVADNSDVGFYRVRLVAYTPIRSPYFDEFTCADSVDRIIYILNDFLQFPNTVTPNGDGVNDIFEIKNLIDGGNFTENEIYIYNQWGRLVYHKKNISTREDFWDPSLTNEPTGTYYYRFYAKGNTGPVQRNGVIELLR
ncbi:MAG: gliding motility-associated C-terminal domain-containing protein, partial [Bacteroidales bacterium]|nr:gliding motility-associated C-terminal domain-containing protein [Bacteroidales bacterium]